MSRQSATENPGARVARVVYGTTTYKTTAYRDGWACAPKTRQRDHPPISLNFQVALTVGACPFVLVCTCMLPRPVRL